MTKDELALLNITAELWVKFLALPEQYPDDINEFRYKIHDIQRFILSRQAERGLKYVKK